jgi:peroxiredoxin
LRSFQQRLSDFDARGIRVVAISNDTPEVNRPFRARNGFGFVLLSDPKAEVIRRYDLLHAGAGPEGADIARPAEFLIDPASTVRWVKLTGSVTARARPEEVLEAVDRMGR